MKFLSKLKKKKKTVIVVVVILVLIVGIASCSMKGTTASYTEETVGKRDIVTYHTFTGNITPVADRNVIASTASKVEKVVVSEGDEVK